MPKYKIIVIFILVLGCLVFVAPEQISEGECPGGGTPPNPPRPGTARPGLSFGLQPWIPDVSDILGAAEPWEAWWTLSREKYLKFKEPLEWIKGGKEGTLALIDTQLYEALLNILVESVKSTEMELAWNSAIALGRTRDPRAAPHLQNAYQESKQILVKNYALIGLGWLKGNAGLETLKSTTLDKKVSELTQSHAAVALGYINDPSVSTILKEIVNDNDIRESRPDVLASAALSLGLIKDTSSVSLLGNLLNGGTSLGDPKVRAYRAYAALALGRIGNEEALNELKKALAIGNKEVRISVAIALGLVNDPRAKDELLTLLKDKQRAIRGLAAISLAQWVFRHKAGIDIKPINNALLEALQETKSAESDGLIVLALGLIGEEASKPVLRNILITKKRVLLRCAAAIALGLIKDKEVVPTLIEILKKKPRDPIFAPYLTLALGMIGDKRGIEVIQSLWETVDKHVAGRAYTNMAVALSMLGRRNEVVAKLIEHCAKGQNVLLRQHALHTLGLLADRKSAKTFVEIYAEERSGAIKTFIVRGIGLMMEPTPFPMLTEWTSDNNAEIATLIIDHLLPIPTW